MKMRILFLAMFATATVALAASVNYQVLKKAAVPGAGGWDYVIVDENGRRVYVTHATQVDVLDADSAAVVGTIPNTPGAHGVAIASEFGRGYISAGKSDAVIPFDLKTLQTSAEIKVGKKPDAIIYEPFSKSIYVMNGDSDSISVLDAKSGTVKGSIELGGGPEYAVSDGKGNVWVNLEEKNETLHIDAKTMKVKDRYPLAPCGTPTALSLDAQNRRLFVGCRSKHLAVLNADTGKVIATYPIGERVDASAFDPSTRMVFLSTGDGKVFVFHQDSADSYTLAQEIVTVKGAKTMGYDSKTKNVFVPTSDNGAMQVLVLSPKS